MKTASRGRNRVVGSLSNSTFRGAWRSGAFLLAYPLLRTIHLPYTRFTHLAVAALSITNGKTTHPDIPCSLSKISVDRSRQNPQSCILIPPRAEIATEWTSQSFGMP